MITQESHLFVGQIKNKLPSCFPMPEQIALTIALAISISVWKTLEQFILNFLPTCVIDVIFKMNVIAILLILFFGNITIIKMLLKELLLIILDERYLIIIKHVCLSFLHILPLLAYDLFILFEICRTFDFPYL